MKFIINFVISFFYLFSPLCSQSDPMPYQVERHIYFCRYKAAQQEIDRALQARQPQPESATYAVALTEAARLHNAFCRFRAADSLLTQAMTIFEKQGATADSNYFKASLLLSNNCRSLGDYRRAENLIKKSLELAEKCVGTPHARWKVPILGEYVTLDIDLCRYQDAELHLNQQLAAAAALFGKKDVRYGSALVAYANLLINQLETRLKASKTDNRPNAEDLLKEARKVLEPLVAQYPIEYLALLYKEYYLFGKYKLNRPVQETTCLGKIETVIKQYLGEEHVEMIALLRTQGVRLQYDAPDFRKAINCYATASRLCEIVLGKDVGLYIGIQQDIASWHGSLGYEDTAVTIRKAALRLTRAIYGPKSTSTANLMMAVASDLDAQGSPIEADSMLTLAENIYREAYDRPFHDNLISVLEKRSDIAKDNKKIQLEWIKKELAMREAMYGRNSQQYYAGQSNLANYYLWNERYRMADSLIALNIRFYIDEFGPTYPRLMNEYHVLALSLRYQKKYRDAEKYLTNWLAISEKNYGQNSMYYMSVVGTLTNIYIDQQKYKEAEDKIMHLEPLIRRVYGDTSQSMVYLLGEKETLYEKTKTPAEQVGVSAHKIFLQQFMGSNKGMYCYSLCSLAGSLYELGQRKEADSLLQLARNVAAKHYPKSSDVYGFIHYVAGQNYMINDEYNKAESCYLEFAEAEKLLGTDPYKNERYLLALTRLYQKSGDYKKSEQMMGLWAQLPNAPSDEGFNNLYGLLFTNTQRFALADSMFRRGLEIAKANNSSFDHFYVNLTSNYFDWGRDREALDMAYNALIAVINIHGKERPQYATACNNYGITLKQMGRNAEAESYFKEAMFFYIRSNQRESGAYANVLGNYALLLEQTGQIKAAIDSMKTVLDIIKKKKGGDHPDYIFQLIILRFLKSAISDYQACDSISQIALNYWEKRDPNSGVYATALEAYAAHLIQIGQFERALPILEQARSIELSLYGKDNAFLSPLYTKFSKAYLGIRDYQRSIISMQEAIRVDSLNLGIEHLNYALDAQNLANIYIAKGDYAKSIPILDRSIAIKEKTYQRPHTNTGKSWELLARAYQQLRQYKSAEDAARKAVAIQREVLGEKNVETANAQQRLASILLDQGKTDEAEKLIESGHSIFADQAITAFGYLPLSQQQALLDKFGMIDFAATSCAKQPSPRLASLVYNNALLLKGIVLQNTTNLRDRLEKEKDQRLLSTYDAYVATKNTITALYRQPQAERQQRLDSLSKAADGLEQNLLKSPLYAAYLAAFDINWAAVKKALRPGEAAIEFIAYKNYDVASSDTLNYAALVIRPEWDAPRMKYLFSEQAIANRLSATIKRDIGYVAALYKIADRGVVLTQDDKDLYQLIWHPIDSMLNGVKKVWFSPAGLLHRINFAALAYGYKPNSSNIMWLGEKYQLHQVRSTRQIIEHRDAAYASKTALLFGDIDFGPVANQSNSGTRAAPWSNLIASKYEVEKCGQTLTNAQYKVNQKGQNHATAEAFLQTLKTSPSPRIIHAATHAYFAPDPLKSNTAEKKLLPNAYEPNPLLRSALVFANANQVDDLNLRAGKNPHIVTAQDIANLDLRNTEIVILSACETGLGDVHNSEGVYGLQRAFLQAGARYVLMSLWEVNDPATEAFMVAFYKKWLNGAGKPVRQAFEETQAEMRAKYEDDVYRWGGFILVE